MFECDCCGLCCMNLKLSVLYSDLDRGDGICRYLDVDSKLCSIYDKRPEKCNLDKLYDMLYKDKIDREKYYKLNYEVCKKLKKARKKDVFSNVE